MIAAFQSYAWPGNARELKSAVDRMVILFDGPVLRAQWWEPPPPSPVVLKEHRAPDRPAPAAPVAGIPGRRAKLELARQLLAESGQNYTWVSSQLGIDVSTLYRWRKAGKVGVT